MKASEPISAYNASYLQGLKNKLISYIDTATDVRKLEECLELIQADEMPCRYTEEELDEVVKAAEEEGYASQKEVEQMLASWKL